VAQQFLQQAVQSGMFIFLDTDLKIDNPQSNVIIDRDKTAQLGLKMSDVGSALASLLGGGYVNYFSMSGRSYKVIPQVQQRYRLNPQQLLDYYIRTADGTLVPLSTIATVSTNTVPESLNHFQQLNSAQIVGVAMPGVELPGGGCAAFKPTRLGWEPVSGRSAAPTTFRCRCCSAIRSPPSGTLITLEPFLVQ